MATVGIVICYGHWLTSFHPMSSSLPVPYRWTPFLDKAMSFKSALDFSINNKNNQHLEKNLRSSKCLFVPLWAAAATEGSELRERLDIDAFGGLQRTAANTVLTIYETKLSTPGGWVGKWVMGWLIRK